MTQLESIVQVVNRELIRNRIVDEVRRETGGFASVPGDWLCRYCQAKVSFGVSKANNIPSRKYWLPMWESRFSHFGSAGFFGGRLGLKAVWHRVQAIPTRYGGSTLLASSRYLSIDHFFASKLSFLKSCRPTTPLVVRCR